MENFNLLKATKIFSDSSEIDCQAMMYCFKTMFKTFKKNDKIAIQGEPIDYIILMLKGSAIVENMDSMGNVSVLSELNRGDVYGTEAAFAGENFYQDSVIASEKCFVLFMNKHRLINPCENRCRRHDAVIRNLMQTVAESNIRLVEKINHMSKKSTRSKLISYFVSMSEKAGSAYFEIPFNKTDLANYLSVDRSAMSSELSKMKSEGIIDFDKNRYRLINKKHYTDTRKI